MKIIIFTGVLFFFFFSMEELGFSHAFYSKKYTRALKVNFITLDGKTVSYKIYGDSPWKAHYLNKSLLDSF